MAYQPTSETPVALAVGVLHDFMLGCITAKDIASATATFHDCAGQWTMCQLRDEGWGDKIEYELTEENVCHEDQEDTPVYDRYYALRQQFCRKVCQTAASSL